MKVVKKLLLSAAVVLGFSSVASAQIYEEGQIDINAGVGLGSTVGVGGGLPIGVSADFGITDEIGVGGYLGFVNNNEEFPGSFFIPGYTVSYTNIIIGARGTYHYEFLDDIDTYGGVMLGYNVASSSIEYDSPLPAGVPEPSVSTAAGLIYGFFIGGRYHFTDNLGAFAEVGYGISWIQLGLTYKL